MKFCEQTENSSDLKDPKTETIIRQISHFSEVIFQQVGQLLELFFGVFYPLTSVDIV